MIPFNDKKPVDTDAINEGLARLLPGKRRQAANDFKKVAAQVREARARETPWTSIVAELKRQGLNMSVQRLKKLLAAEGAPSVKNSLDGSFSNVANAEVSVTGESP